MPGLSKVCQFKDDALDVGRLLSLVVASVVGLALRR